VRLTQDKQHSALRILVNQLLHSGLVQSARGCHAMYLVLRRCRADVGIEATGRCCHQVNRDRRCVTGIGGVQRVNGRFDCAANALRIDRALVAIADQRRVDRSQV